MELTDRDRLDALGLVHAVRMELTLLQRSVSALTIDGRSDVLVLGTTFQFTALAGTVGFELAALLAPAGHSATLLRGPAGAVASCLAIPQAVRVEVQAGRLRFWQESFGPREQADLHRHIGPGTVLHIGPGETHCYTCLEDCQAYNLITPAFTD